MRARTGGRLRHAFQTQTAVITFCNRTQWPYRLLDAESGVAVIGASLRRSIRPPTVTIRGRRIRLGGGYRADPCLLSIFSDIQLRLLP